VIRRLGALAAGIIVFWAVLAALVLLLWDRLIEADAGPGREVALSFSAVAALLCLIPAVATLAWSAWGQRKAPEHQIYAALGGSGIRMFFVLGAGMLLTNLAYFQQPGFWMWVLAFYLFTLLLEVVLVLRGLPAPGGPQARS
jgi:hypothetical protein